MNKLLRLVYLSILFTLPQAIQAQCGEGESYLEIYITPDANTGSDNTRWEVLDDNDQMLFEGTSNFTFCLDNSLCYTFNIYDDFGNGYAGTPPGNYNVLFNGDVVDAGVDFGDFKSIDFGGCVPGSACNFALPLSSGGTYTTSGDGEAWYAYTPDATGRYAISTCNLGNTCNTVIWGYDRCEGAVFENSQETAIFYSDDDCGQQSDVLTHLFGGTTYYIRIGDKENSCAGSPIEWELSYSGPVEGCTDPSSCNYDPLATVDNGSCIYEGNNNCPQGPDLIVVQGALSNSLEVENFDNDGSCYIAEGCIKGYGVRQILRFTTHIKNIGTQDYYIGRPPSDPADENDQWEWDECHGHWHYEGYAEYRLYNDSGVLQPVGFKNGFCVIDLECSGGGIPTYNCSNQGITAGCGDIYNKNLDCQWIDLTDVPNGNYTMVITVNWDKDADALGREETNYDNNFAQVCFNLSRNGNGDAIVTSNNNCPSFTDCLGNQNGGAQPDCEGTCGGNKLAGDLNQNGVYETGDVQEYMSGLLDESLITTPCSDVSGDNDLSILDPVLMMGCILEQSGVHDQSFHSHLCNFPYISVINPSQSAELTLSNHNTNLQFVDVLLQNPSAPVMAFNFEMSGLVISDVQPLITDAGYEINLQHDGNGEILGLSFKESVTPRYTSPGALVRVFYSSLTANEICLSNINQITNDRYEIIQTNIGATACVPADGTGPVQYCAAASNNSTYEWINNVQIGDINNQSGNNSGYGNFINLSTDLNAGNTYDVTLQTGYAGTAYREYWRVWIDYNGDGDFGDTNELVFSGNNQGEVTGSFTVPSTLPVEGISTRMRIAMRWNQNANSCGEFSYGEVEDYTVNLVSLRQDQTITFFGVPEKETSDPPFAITATASSGLPVSLEIVSGPATINNNTITLTGVLGTVVVRATQDGDAQYNPATPIERSFEVIPVGPLPTVTITSPTDGSILTDGTVEVQFSVSGDLVAYDINHIHLTLDNQAYISLPVGTTSYTLNNVALGAHTITTELVNATHEVASNPEATDVVNITIANPTQDQSILFTSIANKNVDSPTFTASATATSGLPVSIEVVSGPATISGNTVTLNGTAGTVVLRATQAGNNEYNAATPVEESFEVRRLNQAINTGQIDNKLTTDAPFDVTATATSGLAVSYEIASGPASINGNTITLNGTAGTVVVRFTQAGNTQYNPATDVERSFIVSEPVLSNQTISFTAINDKLVSDDPFSLSANASSGLPVSFEVVSGPASISGNTVTLDVTVGTVTIRATQDGNSEYNPAPAVTRSFEVLGVDQVIVFDPIPNKLITDAPFSLSANATSALPVSLEIISGPATINGNTITLNGTAGTVIVRASQAGDNQFNPAADVDQSFVVSEPALLNQTITFNPIPNKLITDPSFSLSANASSGLPVSFEVVSGPVSVSGNIVTLDGTAGAVTIRATQDGNSEYNPATAVERSFDVTEPTSNSCQTVSNLALNKATDQSSVVFGAASARGVDGNTNGAFLDGSVLATDNEANPWWEVDLGEVANIEEIKVWNRTDNRRDRLSNYYVLVSETPFASDDLVTLLNDASVSNFYEADEAQEPTSISANLQGRFVRIQLNYSEHLTIAEVEVMGCSSVVDNIAPDVSLSTASTTVSSSFPANISFSEPINGLSISDFDATNATLSGLSGSGSNYSVIVNPVQEGIVSLSLPANVVTDNGANGNTVSNTLQVTYDSNNNTGCDTPTNLALNGSAVQSGEVFSGSADKAIDGDTNGNYNSGSVTATTNQLNAWWELDLGELSNIDEIKLWNRTDNRPDRFSDYYLLVSDVPFSSTNLNTSLNQAGVFNSYQSTNAGTPTTVTIGRTGRYIRIQLNYAEHLTIAEVEVMGCPVDGSIDETPPTASLSTANTTVNAAFNVNLDFSESVNGLTLNDLVVTNGTASGLSGSGSNYSFIINPDADGTVSIQLPADKVADGASNLNTASNTLNVTYDSNSSNDEYCFPKSEFPWHDWIANVKLGNLDNDSGKSNYSDFSSQSADLTAGQNYTIELTTGYSYTPYSDHFSVWIDFNQDKDFDDAGELVLAEVNGPPANPGNQTLVLSANILVPVDAAAGTTRMRVAMKRYDAATSCEDFEFGEVEDYSVNITPATSAAAERALLYFTAERKVRSVELNWISNTDFKNDHFIVERSADGIRYEDLMKVNRIGDDDFSITNYQEFDESPMSGENYYRLKQVFQDGSINYTGYQKVVFDFNLTEVQLYPNPTKGRAWLDLSHYQGRSAEVMIYSIVGQEMARQSIEEINANPIQLDLDEYKNGVYQVVVKVKGHRMFSKKIVVSRGY